MYIELDGVLSAPITVFTDRGEIDEGATREHISFLVDQGINGLITLAFTGEFASLSVEERKQVIKFTVDEVNGRVPVIAGISDSNLRTVLELGYYSEDVGADAVFVLPPYLYTYTDQETIEFFKTVASEIRLHIQVYNTPAVGRNLSPAVIQELSEIDNILSLKDSNPAQTADVLNVVGDKMKVFCGRDTYLLETLALGGAGPTSVTGIVVPDLIVNLYDAWKKGDVETARKIQFDIIPLTNLLVKRSYPAGIKAGLDLIGLKGGRPRRPLSPYTREEKDLVKRALEALGVL